MSKIAIYARVSTIDKQQYDRQINDLSKIIIQHGYSNAQIEIYAEKMSGYQKERPELTRLLNTVDNNPTYYKCIYVTEISRIGRNPRNTREIVDKWTDLGVPLYIQSIGQSTIDTSGKRNVIVSIILQVLMEFADLEAEQTKTRMKSGKLTKAIEGKALNHNLPYGYKSDEKGYLIIDDDEAEIIKQIFDLYISGVGTKVIAKTLNQMKVPTKLNKTKPDKIFKFNKETLQKSGENIQWSDTVIGQILKNTIYKGERNYLDTKINIEPIINPQIFDECNELLKAKTTRNYLTTFPFLLKDIMFCGCCGRKYVGRYVANRKGDKVYKCASHLKEKNCVNRSINISLIESVIYDQVLLSPALLRQLDNPNDIIKNIKVELKQNEQLLKNEEKLLSDKERQIENLLRTTTLSKNPDFEMYAKLETEIRGEIELIKAKIKLLRKDVFQKITTVENYNIEATSLEMTLKARDNRTELKNIFKQFIKKININDLGNGYVLATLTIMVKGVELVQKLKLFIYADGVRLYGGRKEKIYRYLPITKMSNDPTYHNNILTADKNDIIEEFDNMVRLQDDTTGLITINHFVNVKKENRLFINEFDL